MVLPPSAPHDAHGPGEASWLERLKLSLRLSRAGLLVLVDRARPEMLGELVRTLLPEHPELEVHTEVSRILEAPQGSTLVLAPRATDATWLNLNRPVFSYRELKVILWCDAETTLALARQAVDFFDWISHRVECPHRPPAYAVEGIRCALAARVPGIVWLGGDLEACFAAARPRGVLHRISAARPYAELVAEVKAHARAWLVCEKVEDASRLRRVRWALAEAGHRTRAILAEPAVPSPGWRRVHARSGDLWSARERLEQQGARFPGRLGALTNLEPEAVDLLDALLRQGGDERAIEEALLGSADPGTVLGRLTLERGAAPAQALIRDHAPIPVLRAASSTGLRPQRADLEQVRWAEQEDVAWWAAWSTRLPSTVHPMDLVPMIRAYVAEPLLRSRQLAAKDWDLLTEVALDAGEAPVASLWSRRALEMAQHDEEVFLRASHNLARTLDARGEYQEAETLLRRTLPLMEKALGAEHPSYSASLHELAVVLIRQGKYPEAEDLLGRALAIDEKALGAEHPSYGASLHELAVVLARQGKYPEAEGLLRRALALKEKALGTEHPHYGASLHELAVVLVRQGKYPEAEGLLRRVLALKEKALGAEHPSYSASLHTLAGVLESQGRYTEAEGLLRRALAIDEKALGTEHPSYSASLHAHAGVLVRQGKFPEAEDLLRRALALNERTLGAEHSDYGASLQALAGVLFRQGKFPEVESLLRTALAINEKALGADHPSLSPTLANLGVVLANQSRPAEGLPFVERALQIATTTHGRNHPDVAQTQAVLARLQNETRHPGAPNTAREALEMLERTLGPEHPITQQARPVLLSIIGG